MASRDGRGPLLPHREHAPLLRPAPNCDILLLPSYLVESDLSQRPHRLCRHSSENSSQGEDRGAQDVGRRGSRLSPELATSLLHLCTHQAGQCSLCLGGPLFFHSHSNRPVVGVVKLGPQPDNLCSVERQVQKSFSLPAPQML